MINLQIAEALPKRIIVFEFGASEVPQGVKIRKFHTEEDTVWKVWNELHQSWINIKEGDLIRYDLQPKDVYPIDREVFDKTYKLVED